MTETDWALEVMSDASPSDVLNDLLDLLSRCLDARPRSMAVQTELTILALACHRRNLHKGTNVTGTDPETKEIVQLFHPRRDRWDSHFRFLTFADHGMISVSRQIQFVSNSPTNAPDPWRALSARLLFLERGR